MPKEHVLHLMSQRGMFSIRCSKGVCSPSDVPKRHVLYLMFQRDMFSIWWHVLYMLKGLVLHLIFQRGMFFILWHVLYMPERHILWGPKGVCSLSHVPEGHVLYLLSQMVMFLISCPKALYALCNVAKCSLSEVVMARVLYLMSKASSSRCLCLC